MIRKLLLLPVIATALLAGCATYSYRDGSGDYYYGQPGTQYRVYGGYGYPGYYGYGYPGYSGYPGYYGYGSPYWGGYYRYIPSRPHGGHHGGGHGSGGHQNPPPDHGQQAPDRPRPPWRDLGNVGRAPVGRSEPVHPGAPATSAPVMRAPQRIAPAQAAPSIPRVGGGKRDRHRIPEP